MRIKRIHPTVTGAWSHERFLAAVRAAGIDPGAHGAGTELAALLNTRREQLGIEDRVAPNTARRWLKCEQDPTRGAVGRPGACIEIALALGVSLDWLLAGEVSP